MNFTREPIIETVITPKEGCKLVIRNSKAAGGEDYFVDAVEIVSFGKALFFRSMERPKSFLVPVSDYEVIELKETRMVLKTAIGEKIREAKTKETIFQEKEKRERKRQKRKKPKEEMEAKTPSKEELPLPKRRIIPPPPGLIKEKFSREKKPSSEDVSSPKEEKPSAEKLLEEKPPSKKTPSPPPEESKEESSIEPKGEVDA